MSTTLQAFVHTLRFEAQDTISVDLRPVDGGEFPAFTAGSHIDLHLPNGLVRSYSLSNDSSERHRYVVGVLRDRASRGGSRWTVAASISPRDWPRPTGFWGQGPPWRCAAPWRRCR